MQAITRETLFGIGQETLVEQIDQDTGDGTGGYVSGNGLRTAQQYAPDGSVTAIDIDRVMNLEYRFDESGRIVGIDENGTLRRYASGQMGLTMAENAGAVHRFEYDAVGNRTVSSEEGSDGSLSATRYDYPPEGEGNRLLGSVTLSANGPQDESTGNAPDEQNECELTESSTLTDIPLQRVDSQRFTATGAPEISSNGYRYEYDSAQRPVKVFDNGQLLAEYAYNGFGERIKKVVYRGDQKKVTYYLYDGHQLTAEIDSECDTVKQGVFLEDSSIAYLVGRDVYAMHADHLGTPRVVTDESGDPVWSADYDPFGHATVTTAAGASGDSFDTTSGSSNSTKNTAGSATEVAGIDLPYRLPGQYFDAETGTHYNYYRDYDPATGRYLTRDPVGLQGGLNDYAYVDGNPIGQSDVRGLAPDDTELVIDGVPKPVADTAYMDKLKFVLLEAGKQAGDEIQTMVKEMVQPKNLLAAAVMAGALTGIQGVPGVNIFVNAGLSAYTWWNFGTAGLKFLSALIDTGVTLAFANTLSALCDAAKNLGKALADVGASALDIITRGKKSNDNSITQNDIDGAAANRPGGGCGRQLSSAGCNIGAGGG